MNRSRKKNVRGQRAHAKKQKPKEKEKNVHVVRTFARAVKVRRTAPQRAVPRKAVARAQPIFTQCSVGLAAFVASAVAAFIPITRVAAWSSSYYYAQVDAMYPNDDADDFSAFLSGTISMTLIAVVPFVAIILCCVQYHDCAPNDENCNTVSPKCRTCCFGQEEVLDDYPAEGVCKLLVCCNDCESIGCTPAGRCKESCCCTAPPTAPHTKFAQYIAFTLALVQFVQLVLGIFTLFGAWTETAVLAGLSGTAAIMQLFVVWWLRPWSTPGFGQLKFSIGFVSTVLAFLIAIQAYSHAVGETGRGAPVPGWQDAFKYTYTEQNYDRVKVVDSAGYTSNYGYTYTTYYTYDNVKVGEPEEKHDYRSIRTNPSGCNNYNSNYGYSGSSSHGYYNRDRDDDTYYTGSTFRCYFDGMIHAGHYVTIFTIAIPLIFTLSRLLRGAAAGGGGGAKHAAPAFFLEDVEVYDELPVPGKAKKSKGQEQDKIIEREANLEGGKGYVTDKEHRKMIGIAEKGDPKGHFKQIVADKQTNPLAYRGLMTMRTDDGFEDNLAVVLVNEGHVELAKAFGAWLEAWHREQAATDRADERRLAGAKRKADEAAKLREQFRNIGKGKAATSTSITGDQIKQAQETRDLRKAKALEEATTIVVADEVRYQQEWFEFMKGESAVDERAEFNSVADPMSDECSPRPPQQPKIKGITAKKDNEGYVVGLRLLIRTYLGQVDVALNEIAGAIGAMFKKGPNKDNSRIFEKAKVYKGDIRRVTDYFRRSLVCESFAIMQAALEMLAEHELFTIIRLKNRFTMVNDTAKETAGYRDVQALVSVGPQKVLLEIQLHLAPIFALKSDVSEDIGIDGTTGHERYIKFRTLKEKADML